MRPAPPLPLLRRSLLLGRVRLQWQSVLPLLRRWPLLAQALVLRLPLSALLRPPRAATAVATAAAARAVSSAVATAAASTVAGRRRAASAAPASPLEAIDARTVSAAFAAPCGRFSGCQPPERFAQESLRDCRGHRASQQWTVAYSPDHRYGAGAARKSHAIMRRPDRFRVAQSALSVDGPSGRSRSSGSRQSSESPW